MSSPAKRKVSLTLDEDLVAEIEGGDEGLSAGVNAALRSALVERRRQRALTELLDRLEAERGRLDTEQDETEIARLMSLLGGAPAVGRQAGPVQDRAAG